MTTDAGSCSGEVDDFRGRRKIWYGTPGVINGGAGGVTDGHGVVNGKSNATLDPLPEVATQMKQQIRNAVHRL